MRRRVWISALAVALLAGGQGLRAHQPCCEPRPDCFLKHVAPVGGWQPYGGGLLHWWDPHWFPRCGTADDYDRKPLPKLCWPPCRACDCPGTK